MAELIETYEQILLLEFGAIEQLREEIKKQEEDCRELRNYLKESRRVPP